MWYNKSAHRHALYISIVFLVGILLPVLVFAKGGVSKKPVGGVAVADKKSLAPLVVCTGVQGPFSIRAFNNAPTGPAFYYVSDLQTRETKIGSYIIGLYDVIQDTTVCKNPETGAPVPVYRTYPFGNTRR